MKIEESPKNKDNPKFQDEPKIESNPEDKEYLKNEDDKKIKTPINTIILFESQPFLLLFPNSSLYIVLHISDQSFSIIDPIDANILSQLQGEQKTSQISTLYFVVQRLFDIRK